MKKLLFLFLPALVFGQTHIHRSIQNNTAVIGSGGTLTIVDTTATFSIAMPDSAGGRGVLVYYDSTGLNLVINAVCFIKYRVSSTVFGVQRFNGGTPASVTGSTIHGLIHCYTSWENFHNGSENTGIPVLVRNFDSHTDGINLDSKGWYLHVAMYAGAHDLTTTQGGDDIDTSPTEMLHIYAPCGKRFVGTSQRSTTGKLTYRGAVFTVSTGTGWASADDAGNRVCQDVVFEGMQFDFSDVDSQIGLLINAQQSGLVQNFLISDCIFKGSDSTATNTSNHAAIVWSGGTASNGGKVKVQNSLFYGWKSRVTTTNEGAILFTAVNISDSLLVENCTIYKCQDGIKRSNAGNILIIRNTIVNRCNDGFNGGIGGSFNVSDIASDCGGCTNMITGTVAFTSQSTGDFSLQSGDTVAKNAGTNNAAGSLVAPTTDIKNYTRSGTRDVGAIEQGAAASGCSVETDAVSSFPSVIPVKGLQRLRRMW